MNGHDGRIYTVSTLLWKRDNICTTFCDLVCTSPPKLRGIFDIWNMYLFFTYGFRKITCGAT